MAEFPHVAISIIPQTMMVGESQLLVWLRETEKELIKNSTKSGSQSENTGLTKLIIDVVLT